MSRETPSSKPSGEDCPPEERLESWDEIAAYLNQDVGTVQRWHRRNRLPLHGLAGARPEPYACRRELDAWWDTCSSRLEEDERTRTSSGKYARWILAGAALAAGATVGVWLLRPSPLAFGKGDWILITGFDNRTGHPFFDGIAQPMLARALGYSRYLRIIPGERVADVLRRMGKPTDAVLDARLGREVCVCDGGIRAMLTGRIERAGPAYILASGLIDPSHDVTVARNTQRFSSDDQLPTAVLRASDWLREKLGESRASIRRNRA